MCEPVLILFTESRDDLKKKKWMRCFVSESEILTWEMDPQKKLFVLQRNYRVLTK